jgi:hypothetical protein
VAWLCDVNVGSADIIQANLVPPCVPTQIEADWLWGFLQKIDAGQSLLARAQILAAMSPADKGLLKGWVAAVSNLEKQFQSNPPVWPIARPTIPDAAWQAFRELMEAFYEKGLRSGLPYATNGSPVVNGGVMYAQFVQEFRDTHRLNPNPDAREVCVLCGGELKDIEVDHWIAKSVYPLLSVCADNLLPICGECNSTDNKGTKAVHCQGDFSDWFHPYRRHANGNVQMGYDLQARSIICTRVNPADAVKVANLDKLLNLSKRWTREFKAEYAKQQGILIQRERRRINKGQTRHAQNEILIHLQNVQDDLISTEPHYEVHSVLCTAMLEQSRLAAWEVELGLVS